LFSKKSILDYPIFQIGFNRCGTSSIAHFFERNGYRAAHWQKGKIAVGMELARIKKQPLLAYCNRYDIYTDMEKVDVHKIAKQKWRHPLFWKFAKAAKKHDITINKPIYAFKYFKQLYRQYPGSRFILNTRDVNNWIDSRLNFQFRKIDSYRYCTCGYQAHETMQELTTCWRREWQEHHNNVKVFFSDKPGRLLVFNIEDDSATKLVNYFSDMDLHERYWTTTNTSK